MIINKILGAEITQFQFFYKIRTYRTEDWGAAHFLFLVKCIKGLGLLSVLLWFITSRTIRFFYIMYVCVYYAYWVCYYKCNYFLNIYICICTYIYQLLNLYKHLLLFIFFLKIHTHVYLRMQWCTVHKHILCKHKL